MYLLPPQGRKGPRPRLRIHLPYSLHALRQPRRPNTRVSRLLLERNYKVLLVETGNQPNVYYLT